MRNLERATDRAADALIVGADLFFRRVRDRVGLGVEGGVGVAIKHCEAHAVYSLTQQPAALPSAATAARSARATATAAQSPCATPEKSAEAESAGARTGCSREGIAVARPLAGLSRTSGHIL